MKVFPMLMVALLAVGSTSLATAQGGLGKGGGGGSGGGGGGKSTPPPVRGGGGGGGGQSTPPPVRSGGGSGGGGGLGRGGSGGSGGSGGGTPPPTRDRDRDNGNTSGGVVIGGGTRNGGTVITGRGETGTPSKSGRVNYGGSTNRNSGTGRNSVYNIPAPPVINSQISREANREGGRIQRNYDGYRNGYYHYDRGWRDSNFWYPHYSFSYGAQCYPSPFYYYPHLPGYISSVRIDLDFISISWNQGTYYDWRYSNDWGYTTNRRNYDRDLDRATDDIYDSFRRGDMRFFENLIPYRGWVNVEVDRYVQYRIGGDDFYDMMRDLVEGTYTTDYRISRVRTWRGGASIEAQHEYRDPWGKTVRVRHYYGLRDTGRGYEITNFRFDN